MAARVEGGTLTTGREAQGDRLENTDITTNGQQRGLFAAGADSLLYLDNFWGVSVALGKEFQVPQKRIHRIQGFQQGESGVWNTELTHYR